MNEDLLNKFSEKDKKRETYEEHILDLQRQRHERPILDRLREAGVQREQDGSYYFCTPWEIDIKDAINEIETLREVLKKVQGLVRTSSVSNDNKEILVVKTWCSGYNAGNTIPANFVSVLNQNTTGSAGNLSGTQTANFFYAAPNGSSGGASFRAIVAADVPNLAGNNAIPSQTQRRLHSTLALTLRIRSAWNPLWKCGESSAPALDPCEAIVPIERPALQYLVWHVMLRPAFPLRNRSGQHAPRFHECGNSGLRTTRRLALGSR